MPRKSIADVLRERFGGNWVFYTKTSDQWNCEDGRVVKRKVDCVCWKWGTPKNKCRCKPKYIMIDDEGEKEIDISDPRIYRLNGMSTYY